MKNNTALYQYTIPHKLSVEERETLYRAATILGRCLRRETLEVSGPKAVVPYLTHLLAEQEREHFYCLLLDSKHRLLKTELLFSGTVDQCGVHPREVVRAALKANAAAVIFAHNHPSGDAEPSRTDIKLTAQLTAALDLVGVRVLDHFVMGSVGEHCSLAERGLI